MSLTVLVLQQQTLAAAAVPITTATVQQQLLAQPQQYRQDISNTRLHKRHSNLHSMYEQEMHSRQLDWANPCGGVWLGRNATAQVASQRSTPVKMILRLLQNYTGREQKTLRITTPVIDVSDIRMWSLHKETYKFLPVLKLNSNVALRRWHRHVQMYVATFTYLRRAQIHWDYHKALRESEISSELLKLKRSARNILCEIETAINSTSPVATTHKRQTGIHTVPRAAMEKRLKFQTHLRHLFANGDADSTQLHEVNPIDLKFAKYRYFSFLRSMLKVLRTNTRRPGQVHLDSRSSSSSSSSSSSKGSAVSAASSAQKRTSDSRDMSNNDSGSIVMRPNLSKSKTSKTRPKSKSSSSKSGQKTGQNSSQNRSKLTLKLKQALV